MVFSFFFGAAAASNARPAHSAATARASRLIRRAHLGASGEVVVSTPGSMTAGSVDGGGVASDRCRRFGHGRFRDRRRQLFGFGRGRRRRAIGVGVAWSRLPRIRHDFLELALRFAGAFLGRGDIAAAERGAVVDGREREARLDLVGADAFLLLLELVARQRFEQAVLLLRDAREPLLRSPRAAGASASTRAANSPGVVRHGAARLLHAHPAVLRLAQRLVEILERAALVPHARLEGFGEPPVQHALGEARLFADHVGFVVVRRGQQRRFEAHDARPLVALLRRAERRHVLAPLRPGRAVPPAVARSAPYLSSRPEASTASACGTRSA